MRYNTGNPVGPDGSSSPFDLYDNSGVIDVFATDRTRVSVPDRLGIPRKTLFGMEREFNAFLAASGFELPPLLYVDGQPLLVDRPSQLIQRGTALYSVNAAESFPASLSGTWVADQPRLVERSDQSLRQSLSNTTDADQGAALVGLFRKVMNSQIKTAQDFFSASTLDLWEFAGLVTDKPTPSDPATWEWSPAIQAWLNTAAARGDMVKPPIGMFRHSQKIIRPAFVSMVGRGVTHGEALDKGTIFYYDGTDDGWLTTSPINSVSPTHTYTAHVTFYAPNLQIAKGAFVDESSINIELIRNAFIHNARAAGVILDQTILPRVLLNQFEVVGDMSGAGANIWLVNGSDRRPGADKQYTNQAVINFNNFNCKSSQARCVLDDGGIAHEYRGNNYNGGRIQLEAKEVNGMIIDGGEWEFASSANIQVKRPLGSVASPNVTIRNAYLFPAPGGIAVDYHPLASDYVIYENNTIYGVAADNFDAVAAQGATKIKAFGNRNIAGGATPYNNYGVSGAVTPVVLGSTVAGSNSYASRSGRYNREGAMTTVSVSVTLSSKDVAMSGFVDIDCLPIAAGGDPQSGNIAVFNGASLPANHTQLGVATVPGTTRVRLYTAGSGQVGGGLNADGISSAFSITFDVSYT